MFDISITFDLLPDSVKGRLIARAKGLARSYYPAASDAEIDNVFRDYLSRAVMDVLNEGQSSGLLSELDRRLSEVEAKLEDFE